jgi:hypothetical protein
VTAVNRTITTDLPDEPATGSVVLDKNRRAWQRQEDGPRRAAPDTIAYWAPVAASGQFATSATWVDLCHLAPLTVVWEPGAQPEQDRHDDALAAWETELLAAEKLRVAEGRLRTANKRLAVVRESNARRLAEAEDEMADAARAHSATHAELTKAQQR